MRGTGYPAGTVDLGPALVPDPQSGPGQIPARATIAAAVLVTCPGVTALTALFRLIQRRAVQQVVLLLLLIGSAVHQAAA